ncbi:hypothetical protein IQ07DRAFT_386603 [Pyrenochaeta sp. DS3sAY3a]|nr:hypothetical protein IQ07DRAFT_386603 [Pyrenochaeta sp. DS3sAY3a]
MAAFSVLCVLSLASRHAQVLSSLSACVCYVPFPELAVHFLENPAALRSVQRLFASLKHATPHVAIIRGGLLMGQHSLLGALQQPEATPSPSQNPCYTPFSSLKVAYPTMVILDESTSSCPAECYCLWYALFGVKISPDHRSMSKYATICHLPSLPTPLRVSLGIRCAKL